MATGIQARDALVSVVMEEHTWGSPGFSNISHEGKETSTSQVNGEDSWVACQLLLFPKGGGIPWENGSSLIICSVGKNSQWVSLLPSVEAEENPNLLRWSQDWGEVYFLGLANGSYSPETQCCSSVTENLTVFPWCVFPKGCNLVVFMCHFCSQHSSTDTCQSHKLPNHS